MPNKQQQKGFRQAKINALLALLEALNEEFLPSAPGLQMKTGAIGEYLDQSYRPLQPRALLTILREADIPHDSLYRFLRWAIYDQLHQLKRLGREYTGAPVRNLQGPRWKTPRPYRRHPYRKHPYRKHPWMNRSRVNPRHRRGTTGLTPCARLGRGVAPAQVDSR